MVLLVGWVRTELLNGSDLRFDGTPYVAAMLGWLGDSEKAASYMHEAKASDWVKGFGIGYLEPQTGIVHLQPVPIVNGRCVVNGKLFT